MMTDVVPILFYGGKVTESEGIGLDPSSVRTAKRADLGVGLYKIQGGLSLSWLLIPWATHMGNRFFDEFAECIQVNVLSVLYVQT